MHILFITANRKFLDEKSEEAIFLRAMVDTAEALHVVVFTRRSDGYQTKKIGENAWIYPTNSFFPFLSALDAWRIIRLELLWQGQFRAHIIHSDDPYLSGWLGLILAHRHSRVWMINLHRYFWEHDSWLRNIGRRLTIIPVSWIIMYAERICIFSERVRIYIADAASPADQKKIFSLQKIYDPSIIRSTPVTIDLKQKYPDCNFLILVVAPLRAGVRIGLALDVLAHLRQIPGYRKAGLVVVGHGSLRSLYGLRAKTLGIGPWVKFERDADDLVSYYKTANLLLYLASSEEEDDAAITAAAAGCAIVALPSTIASGIIKSGENGLIVEHATESAVMAAIRQYNEVPGLRERFKLNSSAYLGETFVQSHESLIEQLRTCWTYQEAPPEEEHLEHELSFAGTKSLGENRWFSRAKKIITNLRPRR